MPLSAIKSRGAALVVCGIECRRVRRNRLREKGPERRGECADCKEPVVVAAGVNGTMPRRCADCQFTFARERNARRNREWVAANPEKQRQRLERKRAAEAADPERAIKRYDTHLYSTYGITRETYLAMHTAQSGRCAVCQNLPIGRGKGGILVVDHSHESGRVRALLCGKCNIALGLLDDDANRVDLAASYLRRWATV